MSEIEGNGKRVRSPKERRQRNREEMIAAILDAARTVMREEGVAALNLHEVARRVGLRTPSLYEYFPGKMALYDALYRFGIRLYAAGREHLASHHTSARVVLGTCAWGVGALYDHCAGESRTLSTRL
jgi:AcrR family transcriptional regulator